MGRGGAGSMDYGIWGHDCHQDLRWLSPAFFSACWADLLCYRILCKVVTDHSGLTPNNFVTRKKKGFYLSAPSLKNSREDWLVGLGHVFTPSWSNDHRAGRVWVFMNDPAWTFSSFTSCRWSLVIFSLLYFLVLFSLFLLFSPWGKPHGLCHLPWPLSS